MHIVPVSSIHQEIGTQNPLSDIENSRWKEMAEDEGAILSLEQFEKFWNFFAEAEAEHAETIQDETGKIFQKKFMIRYM